MRLLLITTQIMKTLSKKIEIWYVSTVDHIITPGANFFLLTSALFQIWKVTIWLLWVVMDKTKFFFLIISSILSVNHQKKQREEFIKYNQ